MNYQPLEQFDPTILLYFYNEIYISTMSISTFNVFFLSTFLLSFSFFLKQRNMSLWRYVVSLIINFFTFELYNQQVTKKAQHFLVIFFTLFIFILFSNILGLFFYGFTITSHISVTFFLSITFFLAIIFIGFKKHGLHFLHILVPSGAPKALLPFLVAIEFISYIARVFSLAIRLFANMMSGHTLLSIIASFSLYLFNYFFISQLFILPLFVIFVLLFLEFAIAALQAYVFAVLVSIYLNDAYLLDH